MIRIEEEFTESIFRVDGKDARSVKRVDIAGKVVTLILKVVALAVVTLIIKNIWFV